MALVLSGSIDISGSMTATTIVVSAPGAGGMVSSSQQIQNYNLFAQTSSANTFYGNQSITGSLNVSSSVEITNTITATYASLSQSGSATAITQNARIQNYTTSTSNGSGVGLDFALKDSTGAGKQTGQIASVWSDNTSNAAAGLEFYTRPSGTGIAKVLTLASDGYLRLAGAGIQFNGDTAAANSLDDYEEGTWTPVLGGSTSQSGQAYSGQTGYYTKVGRLVTASFRVVLSTRGTITGNVVIKGLPFTADSQIGYGAGTTIWEVLAISWSSIFLVINSNTNFATLEGVKSAGVSSIKLASADLDNTSQFNGSITYFV